MYKRNAPGNIGFVMRSAEAGGATTGLVVTAVRVVDGGVQAPASGVVQDKGGGQYNLAGLAADFDGDQIHWMFTAPGALPEERMIHTTGGDFRDGASFGLSHLADLDVLFARLDALDAAVAALGARIDGLAFKVTVPDARVVLEFTPASPADGSAVS